MPVETVVGDAYLELSPCSVLSTSECSQEYLGSSRPLEIRIFVFHGVSFRTQFFLTHL